MGKYTKIPDQEKRLIEIGIALSKERDIPALMKKILLSAKELTGADGGTFYSVTPEKRLHFEMVISDSFGLSEPPPSLPELPLDDSLMVGYAVNHKKTINIKDAYQEKGYDFSGTKQFDRQTGYKTRAVLTIPIKNHEDDVIAVLQLLNPPETFSEEDENLAESLASQAGVALTNQLLILHLRSLFSSLIRVIAEAIDEKSPSTGNHGKRVPMVALLFAEAVNKTEEGPLKKVHLDPDEIYELEVAAFLHDCGKITTPEHIVEKKTKLEAIFDRIEAVDLRFALLQKEAEKRFFLKEISESEYRTLCAKLTDDLAFLHRCNEGVEQITEEAKARIRKISEQHVEGSPLLSKDEIENLSIVSGNLTEKEREVIKHHVVMTYRMLSQLQYPKELRAVPEIAASHHERVDGKGYPRGLKGEEMSLRARLLAIADVFEALSAPDRSYKKALPLSAVFQIMEEMVHEGHLDPDLFEVFLKKKVYLKYADLYLSRDQIDVP